MPWVFVRPAMSEKHVPERARQKVIDRARGCCEYCRSQMHYSPDPFSVEHVLPRSRGGGNALSNLALSCQGCNNLKFTSIDALYPIWGVMAPLYHPRQHQWSEHFLWSEDFALIIGRTPTGRATIERLQINREGVVNLRRVLIFIGRHPPE